MATAPRGPRSLVPLAAAALILFGAASARAQHTLEVKFSPGSIAFSTPGITEFDAGRIDHPGLSVTVESTHKTRSWNLLVRSPSASLGGYGKPLGDLLWRVEGSAVWNPVTGTDQVVATQTGTRTVVVYFRMRLRYADDPPDTYGATVTFTAEFN